MLNLFQNLSYIEKLELYAKDAEINST